MLLEPGPYLLGVAWRAFALTAIVLLFRNAVLRCREYDADARAFSWDGPDGALRRVLAASATYSNSGRRWSWGTHPPIGRRYTALDDPRGLVPGEILGRTRLGLVSTIAYSSVFILLRSTMETADRVTVRLIGALFFAPLAAVGLTVVIWRAMLYARSAGMRPPQVAAVGVGLGCGIVLGEPLSLAAAITGFWGAGPAPGPALAVLLLLVVFVVSVLLACWIRSCSLAWAPVVANSLRGAIIVAVVATAFVLTPLLAYWVLLRDLHPLIPTMSRQAARDFAMLPDTEFAGPVWLWTALEHPLVLRLTGENLALAAVVLLWFFPVLGLLYPRATRAASRRTLIRVLLSGLVGGAGSILLTQLLLRTPRRRISLTHRLSSTGRSPSQSWFRRPQRCASVGATLFRVVWGLLAAFIVGATNTVVTAAGGFLGPATRQILLEGFVAALAAGILGLALAHFVTIGKEP